MNILMVEDNEAIVKGLSYAFAMEKHTFDHAATVKEAVLFITSGKDFDIIILDVNLPDGNGFELYKETIKKRNIPTLFLTVRDDEDDIVKGLDLGAEDYVTKPFSSKELMARVNRILSRSKKQRLIIVGNVAFDPDKPALFKGEKQIELTPVETRIVSLLFSNLNKVVTRNTLLDKVWEWTGNYVDDHTITVYLNRIRDKIGEDVIITVKGLGYRIDEQ